MATAVFIQAGTAALFIASFWGHRFAAGQRRPRHGRLLVAADMTTDAEPHDA